MLGWRAELGTDCFVCSSGQLDIQVAIVGMEDLVTVFPHEKTDFYQALGYVHCPFPPRPLASFAAEIFFLSDEPLLR